MRTSELIKDVTGFVQDNGYSVLLPPIFNDYGLTVKLILEKDGEKSLLPLLECFYDVEDGKRTKFHGVFDIRNTPWYKSKKGGKA